jgi:hypothetical protein
MTGTQEKRLINDVKSLRGEIETQLTRSKLRINEIHFRVEDAIHEAFCKFQSQHNEQTL